MKLRGRGGRRRETRGESRLERAQAGRLSASSPTPPPRSRSVTPENLQARSDNALATYNASSANRGSATPNMYPNRETITIPPGGFLTHDKAEAAFIHLLKREGVDETWTWDQTMRKIIMDPLYKALDTLAQKKAAFEKVCHRTCESSLSADEV